MNREKFSQQYYCTRNYRDYLSRKFDALAKEIVEATNIHHRDTILDFGCGYGGLANAFWKARYTNVLGTDISQWAIEHGQRTYPHLERHLQFYNRNLLCEPNQLLLMLDVLEHMPEYEVESVLKLAKRGAKGCLLVRIPVSAKEGEPFVLPVSNNDPTHICCHPAKWWRNKLTHAGFRLQRYLDGLSIYSSPGVLAGIYVPTNPRKSVL